MVTSRDYCDYTVWKQLYVTSTGACRRTLRDGAAGPTLVRPGHPRPRDPGLHTLRSGPDGPDLQPEAPAPAARTIQSPDEKVRDYFRSPCSKRKDRREDFHFHFTSECKSKN